VYVSPLTPVPDLYGPVCNNYDPLATARQWIVYVSPHSSCSVAWTPSATSMIRWQQPTMDRVRIPSSGSWVHGPSSNSMIRWQPTMDLYVSSSGSWLRPSSNGYDPLAATDNGSCTYPPPPVPGCMDPLATNYDPLTTDNGSCTYPPPPVPGCMDPLAAGMIRWQQPTMDRVRILLVPGCMDPLATQV
jgi:hypothetical protein